MTILALVVLGSSIQNGEPKSKSLREQELLPTDNPIEQQPPSICFLKSIHPHFIEREKVPAAITQNLQASNKVILYGLVGIGKSELATKYANDHRNEYSPVWTISCSSTTSRELSYRGLAQAMNLYLDEKEIPDDIIWTNHRRARRPE